MLIRKCLFEFRYSAASLFLDTKTNAIDLFRAEPTGMTVVKGMTCVIEWVV
jgi:hypothetical protein